MARACGGPLGNVMRCWRQGRSRAVANVRAGGSVYENVGALPYLGREHRGKLIAETARHASFDFRAG